MIERGNGPAPKSGANSTGTYGGPDQDGSPFDERRLHAPTSGGYGKTYQSMTDSDIPPMGTDYEVSSGAILPATLQLNDGGGVQLSHHRNRDNVPIVQPWERGRFFGHKKMNLVRRSGGVSADDPSRNTIQHPNQKAIIPPQNQKHSAIAGERTAAASFFSGQTLSANAREDQDVGRWAKIKRGAAG